MGEILLPPDCLLIFGLLLSEGVDGAAVIGRLTEEFGEAIAVSEVMPFDHTDYYEPEMGPHLRRQFLAVGSGFDPATLPEVKRRTNGIEAELSEGMARRVNIDPGYLALEKLVLASTKNHGHRIYLTDGIYAEITLIYRRGEGYVSWPWTFPEYRTEPVRAWFNGVRPLVPRRGSGH